MANGWRHIVGRQPDAGSKVVADQTGAGVEDRMNSGPILTIGSTGVDVQRLQTILVMTKLLDYTGIDGNFGPKTQDAVKSFQQASNLTPDGIVGQATWNALPADPNTPHLARGSTGAAVSALQKGLLAFGGGNSATDPGPIDGQFGPKTESAVRGYQTQHGLAGDGIVGDRTWWVPAGGAGATLASLAGVVTV
ncbi:MAG: peptidoglycan-binding protein [Rhodoplanes sp.]